MEATRVDVFWPCVCNAEEGEDDSSVPPLGWFLSVSVMKLKKKTGTRTREINALFYMSCELLSYIKKWMHTLLRNYFVHAALISTRSLKKQNQQLFATDLFQHGGDD